MINSSCHRAIKILQRGGVLLLLFCFQVSVADDSQYLEKLSVIGGKESLPTRPGSAHIVTEDELEKFDYFDIHRLLRSVPGVNVMDEDGFGLRPNIGLRGGHPERSKKVTLLEDGVLIAPAPYSAPAAYYFPQVDKFSSVEVFKGTPSTFFGPNSMGGAINLVTEINSQALRMEAWGGQYGFQKYNLETSFEWFGDWSLDINRVSSTGFKKLLHRDNTGFERNSATLRWDKHISYLDQDITFKLGWSDEKSNETYGGLSDQDFNIDPYQRYVPTEQDEMTWQHRQYFLSYALSPSEDSRVRLTGYSHNFDRSWNKLNGFAGTNSSNPSQDIRLILNDPNSTAYNYYYQVLKGEADSGVLDDDRDVLDIGNNQRQFLSQGVQTHFQYDLGGYEASHLFKLFYRYHEDKINRFHESTYWNMTSGKMVAHSTRGQETTALNQGAAEAHTFAFSYENTWRNLTSQAILRYEDINYDYENFLTSQKIENGEEILAPGVGFFYQAFKQWGFLAGVNKSFNPQGPGQSDEIKPEEAINYEAGLRFVGDRGLGLEFIGFYSDYSNLSGTCTQSGGCTVALLDQVVNGGETEVYGFEFLLQKEFKTGAWSFPININTTYTRAQFQNQFQTDFPEWGIGTVGVGDPIPYIPEWQSQISLGVEKGRWQSFLNIHYLGKMADQAVADGRRVIDPRLVLGVAAHYRVFDKLKLRFRIDNLTDEQYAVSRRPFGLRPGRPFMAMAGVQYDFF